MRLPDRKKHAPKDPEDRAAFLRALELAERFAYLACDLADVAPGPEEAAQVERDLKSKTAKVRLRARATRAKHESIRSLRPDLKGARLEVEDAWLALRKTETMVNVFIRALAHAVEVCADAPVTVEPVELPKGPWPVRQPEDRAEGVTRALERLQERFPRWGSKVDRETFEQAAEAATKGTRARGAGLELILLSKILARCVPGWAPEGKGEDALEDWLHSRPGGREPKHIERLRKLLQRTGK
jgi:hypothetical protein